MAHQKLKHLEKPFITDQIPISLTLPGLPGYDPTCQLHSTAFPRSNFQGLKMPCRKFLASIVHSVQLKILEILDKKCVEPNLGLTYWNKKQDP